MKINDICYDDFCYLTYIAVDKAVKIENKNLVEICLKHYYGYYKNGNKHVFTKVTNEPPTLEELKDKFFMLLNELGNNTRPIKVSLETRKLQLMDWAGPGSCSWA